MNIHDNLTLGDLQDHFSKCFQSLKIEFYCKPHRVHEESPEAEFLKAPLNHRTVIQAKGCEAVSIFTGNDVSNEVITYLKRLGVKYIAIRAAGYDNVGISAANEEDHSAKPVSDPILQKLMGMSNVLITPHQAFAIAEALQHIAATTFHNLCAWMKSEKVENEITYTGTTAEPV